MVVYVDSSALVKRVFDEPHRNALEARLLELENESAVMISSAIGRIEVARAMRARAERAQLEWNPALEGDGLAGIRIIPVDDEVADFAMELRPIHLRSLDAIHCSTAVLSGVDSVITYDARLADAAERNGLTVEMPGL